MLFHETACSLAGPFCDAWNRLAAVFSRPKGDRLLPDPPGLSNHGERRVTVDERLARVRHALGQQALRGQRVPSCLIPSFPA
jgi:hypothetical protein